MLSELSILLGPKRPKATADVAVRATNAAPIDSRAVRSGLCPLDAAVVAGRLRPQATADVAVRATNAAPIDSWAVRSGLCPLDAAVEAGRLPGANLGDTHSTTGRACRRRQATAAPFSLSRGKKSSTGSSTKNFRVSTAVEPLIQNRLTCLNALVPVLNPYYACVCVCAPAPAPAPPRNILETALLRYHAYNQLTHIVLRVPVLVFNVRYLGCWYRYYCQQPLFDLGHPGHNPRRYCENNRSDVASGLSCASHAFGDNRQRANAQTRGFAGQAQSDIGEIHIRAMFAKTGLASEGPRPGRRRQHVVCPEHARLAGTIGLHDREGIEADRARSQNPQASCRRPILRKPRADFKSPRMMAANYIGGGEGVATGGILPIPNDHTLSRL